MKRYALFLSLIAFGYILGWSASVLRFGLPPLGFDRGGPRFRGHERMFEDLGLNDDQKAAIRKIRAESAGDRAAMREKMEDARREFERTLDTTQDQVVLQAAFQKMLQQKNALEVAHFHQMMKIHQVLTPEQIKKLGEKRPRFGRGGPGRPREFAPEDSWE